MIVLKEKTTVWDGYITMEPVGHEVIVTIGGDEIARSTNAIRLIEGGHSGLYYIPRADIDEIHLVPSSRTTHCKWKGDAQYLGYRKGDIQHSEILWMYADALDEVAPLRDCVSFMPGLVDVREV